MTDGLPNRHRKLLTPRGFDELFWQEVRCGFSQKEAFESLNMEHERITGRKRYKNFGSYYRTRREREENDMFSSLN